MRDRGEKGMKKARLTAYEVHQHTVHQCGKTDPGADNETARAAFWCGIGIGAIIALVLVSLAC